MMSGVSPMAMEAEPEAIVAHSGAEIEALFYPLEANPRAVLLFSVQVVTIKYGSRHLFSIRRLAEPLATMLDGWNTVCTILIHYRALQIDKLNSSKKGQYTKYNYLHYYDIHNLGTSQHSLQTNRGFNLTKPTPLCSHC